MKIQSYTLSHNNHKQVPSRQVPLHKREDDERVWLRWNNQMTRELFHINPTFLLSTQLSCYQPTSHATSGHSLNAPSLSPLSPSYLVVLITSKRGKLISAGTLANSGGLLCCFNLLKVVVASDFGNYQHQRLLVPSSLFWSTPCYLWLSPLHLWSLPCYLW